MERERAAMQAQVEQGQQIQRSNELLAEQLQSEYSNRAYQCGSCGFGPIDHVACANLNTHQGEQRGNGRINNACPRCGWRAADISQWPRWNGQLPAEALQRAQ
eukprot:6255950-Prymnesium_polylepis.1